MELTHLAALDKDQHRLLRCLLHGRAGGDGTKAAWSTAKVLRIGGWCRLALRYGFDGSGGFAHGSNGPICIRGSSPLCSGLCAWRVPTTTSIQAGGMRLRIGSVSYAQTSRAWAASRRPPSSWSTWDIFWNEQLRDALLLLDLKTLRAVEWKAEFIHPDAWVDGDGVEEMWADGGVFEPEGSVPPQYQGCGHEGDDGVSERLCHVQAVADAQTICTR